MSVTAGVTVMVSPLNLSGVVWVWGNAAVYGGWGRCGEAKVARLTAVAALFPVATVIIVTERTVLHVTALLMPANSPEVLHHHTYGRKPHSEAPVVLLPFIYFPEHL